MQRDDAADFGGATYDATLDRERLTGQLGRVFALMAADGEWRTLKRIVSVVGGSEAGVSARLRDLRKPQFGGPGKHGDPRARQDVEGRRVGDTSLWEYRMVLLTPRDEEQMDLPLGLEARP